MKNIRFRIKAFYICIQISFGKTYGVYIYGIYIYR